MATSQEQREEQREKRSRLAVASYMGTEKISKMIGESCLLYGVMLQGEEGRLAGTAWELVREGALI